IRNEVIDLTGSTGTGTRSNQSLLTTPITSRIRRNSSLTKLSVRLSGITITKQTGGVVPTHTLRVGIRW
ncbi:hypothetical protein, partial [Haloquadratum walsbyi]|uniref:hypothetical protein n=1 Tax=Haloquadratum walsbyi TaxID=293091 RepID=UPI0026ECA5E1